MSQVNVGDIIRADEGGQSLFGVVAAIDLEKARIDVDWFTDIGEGFYGKHLSFWAFGHHWHKVQYVPSR